MTTSLEQYTSKRPKVKNCISHWHVNYFWQILAGGGKNIKIDIICFSKKHFAANQQTTKIPGKKKYLWNVLILYIMFAIM